jgi:hypothetical protein
MRAGVSSCEPRPIRVRREMKFLKYTAILLAASLLFAVGCGQADSQSELEEEQATKDVPSPKPDATADAQQEKAAELASEPEMRVEDLAKMDDRSRVLLGNCQLAKYQQMYGKKALDEFSKEFVDETVKQAEENPNAEVMSIQEAFIREGVSCTWHELQSYAQ